MKKTYLQAMNEVDSADGKRGEPRFWLWAVAAVFAVFCLMSLAGVGQEWLNHHQGWNGARRSLAAKNYLRYGYIDSKLGSMDNLGEHYNAQGRADKYDYFWHHPPMTNILLSFAFALFGESPTVARLLAACLSWVSFLFMFLALKRLWGLEATFYSLFFLSFIPIYCTYLNFVNHETVLIFSMFGMIASYEQFLKGGRRIFAALVFVFMFMGAFADFPMFPFLFFFWFFTGVARLSGGARQYRFHLLYVSMVALTLLVVSLHLASMQGSMSSFYQLFLNRHEMPDGADLSYKRLLAHWDYYYAFFSPLVYLFSLIYIIDLVQRLAGRRLNRGDAYALSFLFTGLIYVFALKLASIIHEYTVLYTVPFFAMASGFAMYRVRAWLTDFNRTLAFGFVVLCLLALAVYTTPKFFVKASNPIYRYFLDIDSMDNQLKYDYELEKNIVAAMLRDSCRPDEQVLVSLGRRIRREFHYYVDRRFKSVKSPGDFFAYNSSGEYKRYLVNGEQVSSNFLQYLAARYNFINYAQYYIFDLRGDFKYCTARRKLVHQQPLAARYFHSLVHNTYEIIDDPAASLNLSIYWNKKKSIEYWQEQLQKSPVDLEAVIAAYNLGTSFALSPSLEKVKEYLKPPRKESKLDRVNYHGYLISNLPDGRSELTLVFSSSEKIEADYSLILNGKPALSRSDSDTVSRSIRPPVPTDLWQPGLLYVVRSIINLKYGLYDLSFELKRRENFTVMNLKDGDGDFGINCNLLSEEQWKNLDRVAVVADSDKTREISDAELVSKLAEVSGGMAFNHNVLGGGIEALGCFARRFAGQNFSRLYNLRVYIRKTEENQRMLDLIYTHDDSDARAAEKKNGSRKLTVTLLKADKLAAAPTGGILKLESLVGGNPAYGWPRLQLTGREPGFLKTDDNRTRVHIAVGRTGVRQPFAWLQNLDISRAAAADKKKD